MSIAQELYEGAELGSSGPVGLITYMRTDSTRISDQARGEAVAYITENLGERYVRTGQARQRQGQNVQDAHEAIRPTDVTRTPEQVADAPPARPGPPLRPDLAALRGQPDGAGPLPEHPGDHRRGRLHLPRHRDRCSSSTASSGSGSATRSAIGTGSSPPSSRGTGCAAWRWSPSSTSPSRRPATRRPRWSRRWRSGASGGRRPTPPPSRSSRSAPTSARRSAASTRPSWARPSTGCSASTSPRSSTSTSPPTWSAASTPSRRASGSTRRRSGSGTRRSARPSTRPRPTCSGSRSRPSRPVRPAPAAAPGSWWSARDGSAPSWAARGIPECDYIKDKKQSSAEPTGESCPRCGKPLVQRLGKRGPFVGCSGYPKCRFLRDLAATPDGAAADGARARPRGERRGPRSVPRVRQAAGPEAQPPGDLRRLHRLPRLPLHPAPERPRRGRAGAGRRAHRRELSRLRQAAGPPPGALRAVRELQRLPGMHLPPAPQAGGRTRGGRLVSDAPARHHDRGGAPRRRGGHRRGRSGDRWRRGHEAPRRQGAPAPPRHRPGRLRRGGRRCPDPLRQIRAAARPAPGSPPPRRGRAGQGMAHRPLSPSPRGDADRGQRATSSCCSPGTGRSSSPTTTWRPSAAADRTRWRRRRLCSRTPSSTPPRWSAGPSPSPPRSASTPTTRSPC